ncbi:MAG: TonB family protein [Enhygromyxa sp.]
MARQRDIPWALWLGCLAAALLAHAALVVPGGRVLARSLGGSFEPRSGGEREAIELELIEPDETRTLAFVDVDQPNHRRPAKTERVAEHDAAVEREQVAAPVRAAKATAGSSGSARPTREQAEPDAEQQASEGPPEELVAAEDGQLSGDEPKRALDEAERWRLLAGSPAVLSDNFAMPRPSSLAPEVERGPETALDSRAHLYAAFFARMHERILDHYDAEGAIARHDPRGVQLASQSRSTVVRVQLERSGAIRKLSFIEESGVEYLDAEAVRTIRAAGPYPNPPGGLFDEDGELVIHVGFKVPVEGRARVYHSK